MKLMGA